MRILQKSSFMAIALALFVATSAFAHVRVSPRESAAGATQKYTMSVPTEKQSPTVRIEVSFPASVIVTSLAVTQGWTVEERKNDGGKIIGAVWSGGSIPFAEAADFSFEAKNPADASRLEWKVIQIYQDGTRSEWTGPENSRTPSPVTVVK